MTETREEKIKRLWQEIHGNNVPIFYWNNYKNMRYYYNEKDNCFECECGVKILISETEIEKITQTYIYIYDLIEELDAKCQEYFWYENKIIVNYD